MTSDEGYFIGISEGQYGDITNETPPEVRGFFTTNVQIAFVLVAIGKNKNAGRMTILRYVHDFFNDNQLMDIFNWVDKNNCDFKLFHCLNINERGLNFLKAMSPAITLQLRRLFKNVNVKVIKCTKIKNVSSTAYYESNIRIDRNGNVMYFKDEFQQNWKYPNLGLYYAVYFTTFLGKMFLPKGTFGYHQVYDGKNYIKPPIPKQLQEEPDPSECRVPEAYPGVVSHLSQMTDEMKKVFLETIKDEIPWAASHCQKMWFLMGFYSSMLKDI